MSEKIISLNEDAIKQELGDLVRQSVEDTLNTLLDEEADRLTNASRYERTEGRLDTRAGSYKRKLLTKAGEVELKMPRLRTLPFETAIIQRYQKREISVEEALVAKRGKPEPSARRLRATSARPESHLPR